MTEVGLLDSNQDKTANFSDEDSGEKLRGRPRSQLKNQSILTAASELFMEKGFDGTSMDEVAKRAGVSKQTVYSHFSNKEVLFSASISSKIAEYFPDSDFCDDPAHHHLEDDLNKLCGQFIRLFVSDDAISMFRVLSAAATTGGENKLAHLFWKAGPEVMINRLSELMARWAQKGELSFDSAEHAAHTLLSLIKGRHHFQMAIGLIDQISEEEIKAHASSCTKAFLKIYGV